MVRKILNLRVFEDESGKHWSKSVMDKQYEVLCVSQFTLQCILKGNKPDYHMAMPTEQAECFYNNFLEQLRKAYKPELIKDGKFGAYMQVHIQNDGPVTIELESPAATVDPKQNHRIAEVGRDLWRSSSSTPLLKQRHLEHIAQDHVQVAFENLQRRRLRNLSGQPVPMLCHPHSEKVFSHVQMELSVFQFVPVASCAVAGHH
uniref:D-aminoacyl-tRNA deacylase 1 n=2 Tax=Apteryx owenii TaxID=8824 RepID=A0A8B9Q2H3_APTOW